MGLAALRVCKKDARARATSTTTASTPDSRMAKCRRETLTLSITAARSAPAQSEGAGSAAASSAVRRCRPTALRFQSLRTVACSVSGWDVFTTGSSMRRGTPSTSTLAKFATAQMKGAR